MADSESVKLWRDFSKLNLSVSWKADVDKTITDVELWREILAGWHYFDKKGKKHNKHPGIKNLLTEYERRKMDKSNRDNQAVTLSARSGTRVSERSDSNMSQVPIEPPSLYFRTSSLVR